MKYRYIKDQSTKHLLDALATGELDRSAKSELRRLVKSFKSIWIKRFDACEGFEELMKLDVEMNDMQKFVAYYGI